MYSTVSTSLPELELSSTNEEDDKRVKLSSLLEVEELEQEETIN